jgi:hypothetical protein
MTRPRRQFRISTLLWLTPAFLTAATVLLFQIAPASADGISKQLPPDGNWVQFDITGEFAVGPCIVVHPRGTLTLSLVGRETHEGEPCRRIEVERTWLGDEGRKDTETFKLLVAEKFLVEERNPAGGVLKAWKRDAGGVGRELEGDDAHDLDEILSQLFHPNPDQREEENGEIETETPAGTITCRKDTAKQTSAKRDVFGRFSTSTQTWWLADDVPFGVAAYRNEVETLLDEGGVAIPAAWIEAKLAKSGAGAKSKWNGSTDESE